MNRTQELAEEFDHTGARFIIAELDLARMREQIRPNRAEQKEIAEKTSSLQSLLEQLKARLASAAPNANR